jgi:SM-20-related protein
MMPARIINCQGVGVIDERTRRTLRVDASAESEAIVKNRFIVLMPLLETHFRMSLVSMQQPQLLVYRRGCFFRPHQDSSSDPRQPPEVADRRISAVVFLNRQTPLPEPESYCGGQLRLFLPRRMADPRIEVRGQEGLLVAFRSDTTHEVIPVTHGVRFSVVTWYTGPQAKDP